MFYRESHKDKSFYYARDSYWSGMKFFHPLILMILSRDVKPQVSCLLPFTCPPLPATSSQWGVLALFPERCPHAVERSCRPVWEVFTHILLKFFHLALLFGQGDESWWPRDAESRMYLPSPPCVSLWSWQSTRQLTAQPLPGCFSTWILGLSCEDARGSFSRCKVFLALALPKQTARCQWSSEPTAHHSWGALKCGTRKSGHTLLAGELLQETVTESVQAFPLSLCMKGAGKARQIPGRCSVCFDSSF